MQMKQKLARVLRDLVALLEEEAARNSEFAAKLEAITAELPAGGRRPDKWRGGERVSVPDVLAEFQARGEEEFRFWLRDFDLRTMKAIVKQNGFDPARATQKWKDPGKFVGLICEQVRARVARGSSFMKQPERAGSGDPEQGR